MKTADFVQKYHKHFQNGFHNPEEIYGYQVYVPEEWLDYIDAALDSMLAWTTYPGGVATQKYGGFQIHQIKEKFGGLRFYYQADDRETDEVLNGVVMALEGVIDLLEKRNQNANHSNG
jgi:hypothetical protein